MINGTSDILAIVVNYDFSENADRLKANLGRHFETILVDSSSPVTPRTADLIVPNEFYAGQWNQAVKLAKERRKNWLFFVASDVRMEDPDLVCALAMEASQNARYGIYSPSYSPDSRTEFPYCYNQESGRIRICWIVEFFIFLARLEVLLPIYPLSVERHSYGWDVDTMCCYESWRQGKKVVIDDRVQIFHPASVHEIPKKIAIKQRDQYVSEQAFAFREKIKRRWSRRQKLRRWFVCSAIRSLSALRRRGRMRARSRTPRPNLPWE